MPTYQPVSKELLGTKRWLRPADLNFASSDVSCKIAAFEVYKSAGYLPITFLKSGECYSLSIIQGVREGQNLYVGPDGDWLAPYAPSIYRFYPFRLAAIESENERKILCISEENVVSENSTEGRLFFTEDGELESDVSTIFKYLTRILASFEATKKICETLERNKLIKPWNVKVNHNGVESPLLGLHCISESHHAAAQV